MVMYVYTSMHAHTNSCSDHASTDVVKYTYMSCSSMYTASLCKYNCRTAYTMRFRHFALHERGPFPLFFAYSIQHHE
eukprot:c36735_g1_i1 orf=2-229(-)